MCTRKWQWISYFQQCVPQWISSILGFSSNLLLLGASAPTVECWTTFIVKIVCLFWKVCPTADYIMLTWNIRISCLLNVCVQLGNSSFSWYQEGSFHIEKFKCLFLYLVKLQGTTWCPHDQHTGSQSGNFLQAKLSLVGAMVFVHLHTWIIQVFQQ